METKYAPTRLIALIVVLGRKHLSVMIFVIRRTYVRQDLSH